MQANELMKFSQSVRRGMFEDSNLCYKDLSNNYLIIIIVYVKVQRKGIYLKKFRDGEVLKIHLQRYSSD